MEYIGGLLAQLMLVLTYMVSFAVVLAVGYQIAIRIWRKNHEKS